MGGRERVVLVGLLPAVLVIGWLLFAPFRAQTQLPPVTAGGCGPTVVAVFRQPGGDELRFACAVAADDRVVAAGVVGVALASWALLAPRVRPRGRSAAGSLWAALAGGALLLSPFTATGDVYQADDGTTWREPLSCPAPVVALRYANVDGGLGNCADRDALIRIGVAGVAIVVGMAALYAGARAPERSEDPTPTPH